MQRLRSHVVWRGWTDAAFIEGEGKTTALAVTYNNRGNAHAAQGPMTRPSRISTINQARPDLRQALQQSAQPI
jgi:hypothetical protein